MIRPGLQVEREFVSVLRDWLLCRMIAGGGTCPAWNGGRPQRGLWSHAEVVNGIVDNWPQKADKTPPVDK
jgi:hypothetical protein